MGLASIKTGITTTVLITALAMGVGANAKDTNDAASQDENEVLPDILIITDGDEHGELESAFGHSRSIVDTEQINAGEGVTDAIKRVAGVTIRSLGGPGSYASLSVRGLGPAHVNVVVDDMPLQSIAGAQFDLSRIPVESIKRVEVYRGRGPLRFATPLGGVVRVVSQTPGDGDRDFVSLGYGSFATRRLTLSHNGRLAGGALGYAILANYHGSAGDFGFRNDRGTPYTHQDDRDEVRQNNENQAGALRLSLAGKDAKWRGIIADIMLQASRRGIAGSGFAQLTRARSDANMALLRLRVDELVSSGGATVGGVGVDLLRSGWKLSDPIGETGFVVSKGDNTLDRVGLDGRAEHLWQVDGETEVAGRVEFERFSQPGDPSHRGVGQRRISLWRVGIGGGVEHRMSVTPSLVIIPEIRGDLVARGGDTEAQGNSSESVAATKASDTRVSPGVAAVIEYESCQVRVSGGRFHRLPSTYERFGDGGVTTAANPGLGPEQGMSADVGLKCDIRGWLPARTGESQGEFDISLFGTLAQDLIVFERTLSVAVANNLAAAEVFGFEASGFLANGLVSVRAVYSHTRAVDRSEVLGNVGQQVAGVPTDRLNLRFRADLGAFDLTWEVDGQSGVSLDRTGSLQRPGRILNNLFASVTFGAHDEVTIQVSARNLTDLRVEEVTLPGGIRSKSPVADYYGFPLPGRSFFVSVKTRI